MQDKLTYDKKRTDYVAASMNNESIREAIRFAGQVKRVNALLIVKDNQLVVEKYFNGFTRNKPGNLKSITKTITAILFGIAADKGMVKGVEDKIGHYFPGVLAGDKDSDGKAKSKDKKSAENGKKDRDRAKKNLENAKEDISIKNLLTMTAGLETSNDGGIDAMQDADDWVRFVLGKKMEQKPGTVFNYSTGNLHLVSAVISSASDMSTLEFARMYLFNPLDIKIGEWQKDPQGIYHGGNNLHMSAIDLAKIGVLYINRGTYGGKRIISEQWIDSSTQLQFDTGRIWSPFHQSGIGYMWWLFRIGKYEVIASMGHGGQFLFVIPERNAVVVIASRWQDDVTPTQYYRDLCKLMEVLIIPSL